MQAAAAVCMVCVRRRAYYSMGIFPISLSISSSHSLSLSYLPLPSGVRAYVGCLPTLIGTYGRLLSHVVADWALPMGGRSVLRRWAGHPIPTVAPLLHNVYEVLRGLQPWAYTGKNADALNLGAAYLSPAAS